MSKTRITDVIISQVESQPCKETLMARTVQRSLATTTKVIVFLILGNGIAWIWCSYLLAFMGYSQIAESLSNNICNVVIGTIGLYVIKAMGENIVKCNDFGGSTERTYHAEDGEIAMPAIVEAPIIVQEAKSESPKMSSEKSINEAPPP